jgi:thioredoxin-like negative regulator of GroEL
MKNDRRILPLDPRGLAALLERSALPLVLEFWAEWCSPCRQLNNTLEEIAPRYDGRLTMARVDIDTDAELAEQHSVHVVPTLLIFNKQRVVARLQGRLSRDELVAALLDLD